MEFWGVEVKSGQPLTVEPEDGIIFHLSQASLGELKKEKGNESVCLFVNIDGKKLVLGTLSEKMPQQQFDLVFERKFELSHNWKSGSVYFFGYKAQNPGENDEEGFDSESDEDIPLAIPDNGKPETKAKAENSNAVKPAANEQKPKKGMKPEISEEESSDEDEEISDDDDDEMGLEDESDDESDESEEDTPKKVESSKKRPAESATKTPVPDKKAKSTPQKTDGKKGGHVATPHPSKQAGKTPGNKSNQQTPKSGGASHACKECNKTFGSGNALESHNKAKHSAGK